MSDSLLILGRQPALGLAELEALYGPTAAIEPVGSQAARLSCDVDAIDFNRLGGSIKLTEVLDIIDTVEWNALEKYLLRKLPDYFTGFPDGKITLGLSSYGLQASPARINATALSIKKAVRKHERSVRIVPNQETALNSAQVIHNHLVSPNGCEIVLARDSGSTVIARTMAEQDIASYTMRDRIRPKRDTKVGMLPPKLAQILINLATGQVGNSQFATRNSPSRIPNSDLRSTVLDPFCGTGVVLQEALLMGFSVYGTDLEARMIDYTGENLDWLDANFELSAATARFEQGDATTYQWEPAPDFVASETYLGRPFTTRPEPAILSQTISECNTILKKFLTNLAPQIKPGTRLCLAVPAWSVGKNEFRHLPLIDQIEQIGYNRVSFEHVRSDQLLYYREDQIVARELLVLTRK